MKILLLNPIIYTSETSPVIRKETIKDTMGYNLCIEMKKQGIEPVLIVAEDYKPKLDEKYDFEVIYLKTCCKKIFKPNCFPWLKNLNQTIKSINPDLIISSEVFSLWSLLVARKYTKKTIIWHELAKHNNMMKKIPSRIWYNIIAKFFMKNVRVVARSNNAKNFIKRYCNNVSEEFIDHGVELEKFNYTREKENVFIVVSQLIDRKRIDGIIVEFNKFLKNHKEYKLLIVGDGDKRQELESLTKKLNISLNVEFKGNRSHKEIIPMLAKSKAMIINTIKDNSMLTIVESIACGTPVVTTDVPYNCYYIEKDNLGIVCKDNIKSNDLEKITKENDKYVKNCIDYRYFVSNEYHIRQFISESKFLNN